MAIGDRLAAVEVVEQAVTSSRVSADAGLTGGARLVLETVAAKSAELGSQALLLLLLPRAFGPSVYGEFAAAFGAVSLVSIAFGFGAPLAAMRYVPSSLPGERRSIARAVAEHVAVIRARQLGVLTVVVVAAAALASRVPLSLVLGLCVAGWFSVASTILSELALALGRTRIWNSRFPLENLLVILAALGGNAAFGADGTIGGVMLASVATFGILAALVIPDLAGAPRGAALPAGAASYARFETASAILATFVLRGGPPAMLLLGASNVEIGFGAIAAGIGAGGVGVVLSLVSVQLPGLADIARTDFARAEKEARRHGLVALGVAVAATTPAVLFARPILSAALGPGFVGAREAVVIALCAPPLAAAVGLASQLAHLRFRPEPVTIAWTGGAVAFCVIALAAVPGLEPTGASLAMVGALAVTAGAALVLLRDRALCAVALVAAVSSGALAGLGWADGALW